MHLVALAWMFVVVLMSLAEATSSDGSVLGALVTFVLYGVVPLAVVLYLMGTPMRRRARLKRESAHDRDGGGHPAGADVAPKREEP